MPEITATMIAYVMSQDERNRLIGAARAGDVRSEYRLPEAYATGVADNTFDMRQALFWLNEAADAGLAPAA